MAILSAMGGVEQIAWWIEELGSLFTDASYLGAGICLGAFENGTYDEPENILHYVGADGTATFGYAARGTRRNLEPGRYAIYGFTHTPADGGRYWNVWPESGKNALIITVKSAVEPWDWSASDDTQRVKDILDGNCSFLYGSAWFPATVWNGIVDKVHEMRKAYKEKHSWAIVGDDGDAWTVKSADGVTYLSKANCKVNPGDTLTADIYNSVRFQVGSIPDYGTGITDRAPDDKMLGYHITHMVDVLNQIINEQL